MKKKIKYYKIYIEMNNLKEFSQSKYNNSLLKRIKNKRLPEDKKIKKEQKKFYTKRQDFSIVPHNPNKLLDSNSTINMTKHAENRRMKRNISMKEIKKCIKNGKCMDVEYLNSNPKKYVYKYKYNNLSVVYSLENKFHNIITVY